ALSYSSPAATASASSLHAALRICAWATPTPTRKSRRRRPKSPARPNSTPWSPTCRASASTHRAGTDMVSGIFTLILMLLFVALWAWAWQPRKRRDFDEAARLALDEEEPRA